MENEEKTVDFQDETQEEETFEVEESEEQSDDDSTDNDENSTQYLEELKRKDAEIAKLNRLLKKQSKDEKPSEKRPSNDDNVVTKADLERIRLEAKGYDEDQVNFLMRFGGSEALKDEAIQTVVKTMKEKKQQIDAQASGKSQGKSIRRYSQDELRNMPLEQLDKLIKEGKIK